tara:strand:- start:2994 stop:3257 length:264 start_codon:yes stop_codon:yes gene_type:complete
MLPDRCSVKHSGKDCVNPPEFVIEIIHENDSFMVGITCNKHKNIISEKIIELQSKGKIPKGKLQFEKLKSVGTDCVRIDSDELIQLD